VSIRFRDAAQGRAWTANFTWHDILRAFAVSRLKATVAAPTSKLEKSHRHDVFKPDCESNHALILPEVRIQQRAQCLPGPMQAGFDCIGSVTQHLGCLFGAELLNVAEHEHSPIVVG
jgi:hypothetical protein